MGRMMGACVCVCVWHVCVHMRVCFHVCVGRYVGEWAYEHTSDMFVACLKDAIVCK